MIYLSGSQFQYEFSVEKSSANVEKLYISGMLKKEKLHRKTVKANRRLLIY